MKADRFIRVLSIIFLMLIVVFFCPFASGKIIYVDDDTVGLNDGSSWQNAYTFLQDALANAETAEKPVEIRVAQGIYKPDQGIIQTHGDRTATFRLINGVTLKGGYAGAVEPNAIDIELYETILNGDLSGNDIDVNDSGDLEDTPHRYDYSWHVVTGSNTDETAVLDGFTITGGYIWVVAYSLGGAPSGGAGMLISSGSPTLIDCTFTDNETGNTGGGLLIYDNSNPTLINCKFTRNNAESGGGIFGSRSSSPTLINCTFSDNYAKRKGGGMYIYDGNPMLTNCTFIRNSAPPSFGSTSKGGGMYFGKGSPVLTNCTFNDNISDQGGAVYNDGGTSSILAGCTFICNLADHYGGAIYNNYTDCNLIVTQCVFKQNSASQGGAMNIYSPTLLSNCIFTGNSAAWDGGAISAASAIFDNCIFSGNRAIGDERSSGGAVHIIRGAPFDTTIEFNKCTFNKNWAELGCAISCSSTAYVNNCVLWGSEDQIRANNSYQFLVDYSDIKGGWTWPGESNIDADPCFADSGYWADADDPNIVVEPNDPNAVWIDGDYHLKSQAGRWDPVSESWVQDDVTSPCIDAGDPNSPIGHEPFPNGGIINMGAYGGTAEASKSPSGLHSKYGGGTGEPNTPYLIYTAEQMNTIGLHEHDWDKNFKLMADIDLSAYTGTDFNIIGYVNVVRIGRDAQVEHIPCAGVFDGNGHKISNFSYAAIDTGTYTGGIGIFKIVSGENAQIKNLGLIGPNISGQDNVGSLVGEIDSGTVSGCYVEGGSVSADGYVVGGLVGKNGGVITNCTTSCSVSGNYLIGGLVGYNRGTITDCHSSAIVLGTDYVGGLVGSDWNGTITRCASSGSISGTGGYVGGLLGHNNYGAVTACYSSASVSGTLRVGGLVGENEGTISNCFSAGSVTGTYATGGLIGFNWGSLGSTITNCYSTGSVLGTIDTGGFVGSNNDDKDTVKDCFWDIQTSEQSTSAGGTGKITSEMQMISTFLEAGWDFVDETANGTEDIWWILEGQDYPRLWWEGIEQ